MKKLLLITAIITVSLHSYSQQKTIGFRGGVTAGFTYQKFIDANRSMEALVSFRKQGIQLTVLRQIHEITLIEHIDNLYLIKGYGFHAGFFNEKNYKVFGKPIEYPNGLMTPVIGLNAYAALEYRLPGFPLVFGADVKPFIEFFVPSIISPVFYDFGFYLKYNFSSTVF